MKLTRKIQRAIVTASSLHHEKKRKADGSPYITHPFSVAFLLTHYTDDEDIFAAALLHDVLEDVPTHIYGPESMKQDFGYRVYEIVKAVSEDEKPVDKPSAIASWKERKEKYLANLQDASTDALMVCCADKIHNLLALIEAYKEQGDAVFQKFNAPREQMMWFFKEVLKIMKKRLSSPIVDDLDNAYRETKNLLEKK